VIGEDLTINLAKDDDKMITYVTMSVLCDGTFRTSHPPKPNQDENATSSLFVTIGDSDCRISLYRLCMDAKWCTVRRHDMLFRFKPQQSVAYNLQLHRFRDNDDDDDGKVFLAHSDRENKLHVWRVLDSKEPKRHLELKMRHKNDDRVYKTRYAVSWDFSPDMSMLACGDLGGCVYLFDKNTSREMQGAPSHVAQRAHGKYGVDVVTWHSEKDLYVQVMMMMMILLIYIIAQCSHTFLSNRYSAGRDGMICRFRLRLVNSIPRLCHVELIRPSLTANISRVWWHKNSMFLAGFSSKEFRVVNQTTNRIAMSVKRISYRRPWDMLYDRKIGSDDERIVHIYATNDDSSKKKSRRGTIVHVSSSMCPRMFRYPFHSRRTDVAVMCLLLQDVVVVVSAGENRQIGLTSSSQKLYSTQFFDGHTSGIRSLCVAKWNKDDMTYVFSGGGADMIIAWELVSPTRIDMLCRFVVDESDDMKIDEADSSNKTIDIKKINFKTRKKKRKKKFEQVKTTSYAEQRVLSLSKLLGHRILSTDSSGRIQVLRIQKRCTRMRQDGIHQAFENTRSHEIKTMLRCVRYVYSSYLSPIALSLSLTHSLTHTLERVYFYIILLHDF